MAETPEPESAERFVIDAIPVPSHYVNLFGVAFWPEEVILSFARKKLSDGIGEEILKIYSNHATMKRLAYALLEAIREYEANFGEIKIDVVSRLTPEARSRLGLDQETTNEN